MSAGLEVIGNLQRDLPLPLGHLVTPESVPVEAGEAVDHDGDGQGQDEQPSQGTKSADQTTKESLKHYSHYYQALLVPNISCVHCQALQRVQKTIFSYPG